VRRFERRSGCSPSLIVQRESIWDKPVISVARFGAERDAQGGKPADRSLVQRYARQVELIENIPRKQRLAMNVRSRLRVICATPVQKRPDSRVSSGSFVACAEAIGNCDVATEGASRGRPVLGGSLKSTQTISKR